LGVQPGGGAGEGEQVGSVDVGARHACFLRPRQQRSPSADDEFVEPVFERFRRKLLRVRRFGPLRQSVESPAKESFEKCFASGEMAEQRDEPDIGAARDVPHGRIRALLESGDLRIKIDSTYPLQAAAQAHERAERGHIQGKLVLTVA